MPIPKSVLAFQENVMEALELTVTAGFPGMVGGVHDDIPVFEISLERTLSAPLTPSDVAAT